MRDAKCAVLGGLQERGWEPQAYTIIFYIVIIVVFNNFCVHVCVLLCIPVCVISIVHRAVDLPIGACY